MALIRCKKCGNPASSRSKACPICGEPIAQEVALENTTTAASAPQSTPQPTTSTPSESAPKTLNDILAEGRTAPDTQRAPCSIAGVYRKGSTFNRGGDNR